MGANRRLLALGATLILAIVALVVARSGNDAPPASTAAPQPGAIASRQAFDQTSPTDVNLERLNHDRGQPTDSGRNPFRFRPKPAPLPPAPPPMPRRPTNSTDAQPDGASNIPAGPPPPPPISGILKFIGVVEKTDGTRIAVLTDGKRPISGREGEEIEGRFKILKIGNESLEISYIDGRGRTQLRMSGQ